MQRRISEMDKFIKYIAEIVLNNPDLKLDHNIMYGEYTRIGLTQEERYTKLNNCFSYWINRFQNTSNINVFVSEKWKYFCQFTNGDNIKKENTHIKMYVPIKPNAIVEGANMIFDFLAANNIEHLSKIGSKMRNDCIVIRVGSKEDANKVAYFVNNTPLIKDNLMKSNPFLLSDGNIAYATDGSLSYNSVMSDYILGYINSLPKEELVNVNTTGLLNYIMNQYNKVFVDGNLQYMSEYEKLMRYDDLSEQEKIRKMTQTMEITKLVIYSLNGENNLNRVLDVYDEINNYEHMKNAEDLIYKNYHKNNLMVNESGLTEMLESNKNEILFNAISSTFNAYGYEHTKKALERYVVEGNANSITRTNNSRQQVISNLTPQDVKIIIEQQCGSLNYDLYINRILDKKALEYKETVFEQACISTMKKYNALQLDHAISEGIKGNFKSFTNTNRDRELLIQNVNPNELVVLMQNILIKNGINQAHNMQEMFIEFITHKIEQLKQSELNSQENFSR